MRVTRVNHSFFIFLILLFLYIGSIDGFRSPLTVSKFQNLPCRSSLCRLSAANDREGTGNYEAISSNTRRKLVNSVGVFVNLVAASTLAAKLVRAVEGEQASSDAAGTAATVTTDAAAVDFGAFKVPFFHSNIPMKKILGEKATVVVNMKLDDPQTAFQFPGLTDLYSKYVAKGLNVLIFPTDQGWFEPDDDETCRLKAKEYYQFGDFPHAVVLDKVDLLGPSAHPLYVAMTSALPTPNGYNRITLNYEKFLLDAQGNYLL